MSLSIPESGYYTLIRMYFSNGNSVTSSYFAHNNKYYEIDKTYQFKMVMQDGKPILLADFEEESIISNYIEGVNNMATNRKYQKSAVRTYNSTTQTVTSTLTTLNLLGSTCCDTGCSLTPGISSVTVNNSGLYYISADVTFTPTAAGTEIIQLYKDGVALPCAISQTTGAAGSIFTTHIETVLPIGACCAVQPQLTVKASGVAGGVNFVGMSVIRLA